MGDNRIGMEGTMNRTRNPRRGGVPKGKSWTLLARVAAFNAHTSRVLGYPAGTLRFAKEAVKTVERHSRSAATRAEARRLLAILERR